MKKYELAERDIIIDAISVLLSVLYRTNEGEMTRYEVKTVLEGLMMHMEPLITERSKIWAQCNKERIN